MASIDAASPPQRPPLLEGVTDAPGRRDPLSGLAGHAAVAALRILRALPVPLSRLCLRPALPLYRLLRQGHMAALRARFAASPYAAGLAPAAYYRRRLDLLLRGLKAHGAPPDSAFSRIETEGAEIYREALASGRPVVLLGLHAGPLELLHRLPAAPPGRPFCILTAPAFAPALSAYMARGRERDGKRVLWIGGRGMRGLESGLRSCLENRGVLALMVDQHPGNGGDREWLDLWGRLRVPYPGRLLRFLEGQGCIFVPVSAALAGKDAKVRFHGAWGTASPAWVRDFLERAIGRAPDQWNWSYPGNLPAAPPVPAAIPA